MYHPRLRSIQSPLTPIPPMSQSSFDFSPNAIKLCLEASKSTTPTILKSRRNFTPDSMDLSPPDISPIDFAPHSANRIFVSPSVTTLTNEFNSSINMSDESFYVTGNNDKSINTSNINNHSFNITSILIDLKLQQYRAIFEMQEIDVIAFLLLNDEDLQLIGVKDEGHRQTFLRAINEYKYYSGRGFARN